MKKFNEYSKNGLIIFGLTNAFINVVQQVNSIKENPDQKFDWSNFLKAGGKGALLGAIGQPFTGWEYFLYFIKLNSKKKLSGGCLIHQFFEWSNATRSGIEAITSIFPKNLFHEFLIPWERNTFYRK